jgi:hypothetical protein
MKQCICMKKKCKIWPKAAQLDKIKWRYPCLLYTIHHWRIETAATSFLLLVAIRFQITVMTDTCQRGSVFGVKGQCKYV